MIRITFSMIRPNTNVDWWFNTPDGAVYSNYRASNYSDKISNPEVILSDDGLAWTYSVTWATREDYEARLADDKYSLALEARAAYNLENGITETKHQIVNL